MISLPSLHHEGAANPAPIVSGSAVNTGSSLTLLHWALILVAVIVIIGILAYIWSKSPKKPEVKVVRW